MNREHATELLQRERQRVERALADLRDDELDQGLAIQLREELEGIERAEQRVA